MTVLVHLHVYSGAPDPYWVLDGDDAAQLQKVVGKEQSGAVNRLDKLVGETKVLPSPQTAGRVHRLGYSGFSILGSTGSLPSEWYVYNNLIDFGAAGKARRSENSAVERFLLTTAPSGLLDDGIHDYLVENFDNGPIVGKPPQNLNDCPTPMPTREDAPVYKPLEWNERTYIRLHNNCYNYATDTRNNSFAQPGRGAALAMKSPVCKKLRTLDDVVGAAVEDKLIFIGSDCPPDPEDERGHLVALFGGLVTPHSGGAVRLRYHWLRQDKNGNWSHKVGDQPVSDTDNRGDKITDPRCSDLERYPEFGGWFLVPNEITIG